LSGADLADERLARKVTEFAAWDEGTSERAFSGDARSWDDRDGNLHCAVKSRVLIIDDDTNLHDLVGGFLTTAGHEVLFASSAQDTRQHYSRSEPDVILLDWRLPDADGLELLPELKRHWPASEVIFVTGFASFDTAVEAVKRGAFHFLSKPFPPESLGPLLERACEHRHLHAREASLQRALNNLQGRPPAVFSSAPSAALLRLIERVAASDAPVLITGESGTGKEVVADLIHTLSPRAGRPFVKVNCAALPRGLIESELFGVAKGAYTGADTDRDGLFHHAANGSILLDEITEMPLDTQAKLLRVLQERVFRPVGGRTRHPLECRVMASTNRRLEEALRERRLREDVYYRLSVLTVHLPPLRERRADILPLAMTFLRRFAAQAGRPITGFDQAAAWALTQADWPGNVRQLENEVQRAVLLCEHNLIRLDDLRCVSPGVPSTPSAPTTIEDMVRLMIVQALQRHHGNRTAAARELGIDPSTLFRRIKAYGLTGKRDAPETGPGRNGETKFRC